MGRGGDRQTDRKTVSHFVLYAQSTSAVISGRTERQRQTERWRQTRERVTFIRILGLSADRGGERSRKAETRDEQVAT